MNSESRSECGVAVVSQAPETRHRLISLKLIRGRQYPVKRQDSQQFRSRRFSVPPAIRVPARNLFLPEHLFRFRLRKRRLRASPLHVYIVSALRAFKHHSVSLAHAPSYQPQSPKRAPASAPVATPALTGLSPRSRFFPLESVRQRWTLVYADPPAD